MAQVNAPMPGIIYDIKVAIGDTVIEDQEVLTLEAMKMEMPIAATAALCLQCNEVHHQGP